MGGGDGEVSWGIAGVGVGLGRGLTRVDWVGWSFKSGVSQDTTRPFSQNSVYVALS